MMYCTFDTIVLQLYYFLCSFFFLSLPFALSIAGTVQISRQLAKKRYKKARTTAWLCILEGSVLMALAAALMWALRNYSGVINIDVFVKKNG